MAERVLVGGLADHRPMPRTVIAEGRTRAVYRYHSDLAGAAPVLLVPPLAVGGACFDLRRGCSLVEHLVNGGRSVYSVEYGEVGFDERRLGLEHWIDNVIPAAVDAVHRDADRRPVHLVGWCLGGILAALTIARDRGLPVASLTVIASPFDFRAIPLIAPLRPLDTLTGNRLFPAFYRTLGAIPAPVVKRVFQVSALDKHLTKPFAIARNLGDRDYLAQVEAVDRFAAGMLAYPGRAVGQIYHKFYRANALAEGVVTVAGRRIELARVDRPVLVVAGRDDTIAPPKAVRKLVDHVADARFAVAGGGHLGVLTGRGARHETWQMIDAFHRAQA
ncbi:alpha/beta fold hydrolase [Actinokineospora auranticolor]|uniref:alpha/beta fold hydrolase n=1 Tax=Actinokineospora auranticolor TaxID=155976 RepID=UPI0035A849A4